MKKQREGEREGKREAKREEERKDFTALTINSDKEQPILEMMMHLMC